VTPAVTAPPTSTRPAAIKKGNWFVHFGKIAGIAENDPSVNQILSFSPQTLGKMFSD
jgi:hypothetical protein